MLSSDLSLVRALSPWFAALLPFVVGACSASSAAGKGAEASSGGALTASGGAEASSGGALAASGGGTSDAERCAQAGLSFKSARKTNYESYPEPGSEECVKYNGCMWEGQFAACEGKKSEQWVQARNIASVFPNFEQLKLHDLCLRQGDKTIVVTVLDTCGDSDCDGCCTANLGNQEALIDLEKYTNQRFGIADGVIEWADLGPTAGAGCN